MISLTSINTVSPGYAQGRIRPAIDNSPVQVVEKKATQKPFAARPDDRVLQGEVLPKADRQQPSTQSFLLERTLSKAKSVTNSGQYQNTVARSFSQAQAYQRMEAARPGFSGSSESRVDTYI